MTFMYNIMQTDGMLVFEIIEIEQQNDHNPKKFTLLLCMMTLLMMIKNIPLTMHSNNYYNHIKSHENTIMMFSLSL